MFYGILSPSLLGYILISLVFTHITIVSVTVFLHRSQTHGALNLHPVLSHFFRFWLWLTTGMVTKAWVAIHRKHHANCERELDPHSPQRMGLKKVLWEGAELYRREAANLETLERYGHGTPDDWLENHLYVPHTRLGVVAMFILNLVLFGIPGIAIWALQMVWIPFFAAGIINGVGHYSGYRNFECSDAATNVFPWGMIIGGEELHNNHHTYPTSAKFSVKWWELDMGWLYIQLFKALGLAKVKRSIPKTYLLKSKTNVDDTTLKAILINRFQVMSNYTKKVLLPVYKEEKNKAGVARRKLFGQIKNLIVREDSLIDPQSKLSMSHFLETTKSLKEVYAFRQKLQALWSKTTATQRELVEALEDWCKQAEQTEISALKQFAIQLKRYSI